MWNVVTDMVVAGAKATLYAGAVLFLIMVGTIVMVGTDFGMQAQGMSAELKDQIVTFAGYTAIVLALITFVFTFLAVINDREDQRKAAQKDAA